MSSPTISFLSDYGRTDEFVGVVHAVIASIAPGAQIIDINHDIAPFDIRGGSLSLVRSVQYLPAGMVLAVVDPGVGTERRAVAVEADTTEQAIFVGPDNGLLASAVAMCGGARRAVSLTNEKYHLAGLGPTFAGRDVFAPVAAHIAGGVELSDLGEEIDPITLLPGVLPLSRVEDDGSVRCEVLWVDRYGNVQLNVGLDDVDKFGVQVGVRYAGEVRTARRVQTFGELQNHELGILVDSYGMAALVYDQASASGQLKMGAGSEIILQELT